MGWLIPVMSVKSFESEICQHSGGVFSGPLLDGFPVVVRMPVVQLDEQFVDDFGHVRIFDPVLENGPLGPFDVHLQDHRVVGLQLQLLLHEPGDVHGRRIVHHARELVVIADPAQQPRRYVSSSGFDLRPSVALGLHPIPLLVPASGEFEQVRIRLKGVDLCKIDWVPLHEPQNAGGEVIRPQVDVHPPFGLVQIHFGAKKPVLDLRLVVQVVGEAQRDAPPVVVQRVQSLDQVALDPAFRRRQPPFQLIPRVLGLPRLVLEHVHVGLDGVAMRSFVVLDLRPQLAIGLHGLGESRSQGVLELFHHLLVDVPVLRAGEVHAQIHRDVRRHDPYHQAREADVLDEGEGAGTAALQKSHSPWILWIRSDFLPLDRQ
ncbi:hypothetical protein Mapa_010677 [Marchantia paleacea]|nr:hypothetical protein Mapa_010677 [Marchantia paleacea]